MDTTFAAQFAYSHVSAGLSSARRVLHLIKAEMALILKSSTSILIAHRLSTVRSVDRILVLQQGRIIEEGNHAGLMNQGGHYAELYDTYFRHQSPDYRPPVWPASPEPALFN